MPLSIAIVCEAPADARTVRALAERVLMESCDWIEAETLADHIEWRGFRKSETHLEWMGRGGVQDLAKELGIRVRWRLNEPIPQYGHTTLKAIQVLIASPDPVDGMVLIPDSDNRLERRNGLLQGREHFSHTKVPIIVGLAHTKRECWHIAGFTPTDKHEETRLDETRALLEFDPTKLAHKLTGGQGEARCPKRVLAFLTQDNWKREMECLQTPFPALEDRGSETGLPEFLAELRTRLTPAFGGSPRQ
ncbi:type 1 periplasmic-binding domain-containing protein [Zavarzinella formosa]|uniref:hypothetical protein n=1 Tax=Zavarzinella formosa TaxID=360055 RepID=UPI0002F641A6|nr:hypothetical protein [Zavarzinella formosa]